MSFVVNNSNYDENFNFHWYLDKFKNNEMTWEIFFQMMNDMISADFAKSKKLNIVLLEELRRYKELQAENNILKMELQGKNEKELDEIPEPLTGDKYERGYMAVCSRKCYIETERMKFPKLHKFLGMMDDLLPEIRPTQQHFEQF